MEKFKWPILLIVGTAAVLLVLVCGIMAESVQTALPDKAEQMGNGCVILETAVMQAEAVLVDAKALKKDAVIAKAADLPAGTCLTKAETELNGTARFFTSSAISDDIFARIRGKSYNTDTVISRGQLRYLKVLHYSGNGNIYVGELICHQDIASKLLAIFKELYHNEYPIEKMFLVDRYNADDIASASDNNTSCFNIRISAGEDDGWSMHSFGKAIDINPLYNPYVWWDSEGVMHCEPDSGIRYVDRSNAYPYKLTEDDLCVKLFKDYGFSWGGEWKHEKDYMHFAIQ